MAILAHLVLEYGPKEMRRQRSDPSWFQAFGCLFGRAVDRAAIDHSEKRRALKRLAVCQS